jgi:hypothetical protein
VLVASYVEIGQEIAGQTLTAAEAMDINIARGELFGVAKSRGVPVFHTIEDAVQECIRLIHEADEDYTVIGVR